MSTHAGLTALEGGSVPTGRTPVKSEMGRFMPAVLMGAVALLVLFSPNAVRAQVANSPLLASGHTPLKVLDGSAMLVKHYEPSQMLRLAIVLTPPHPLEERQFLEDVQNKNSPLFHRFLTDDEWNARFAPAIADEQAVVDWAKSQGLTVTQRYPNRIVVDVEAPAGTIEKALGVTINNYQVGPDVLYSNDRDPVLPASLTGIVDSVFGLNSIEHQLPKGGTGRFVPGPDYVPGPVTKVGESAQKDASPNALSAIGSTLSVANVTPPAPGYWQPTDMFSSNAYDYRALMNQGHCCNPTNNPGNSPPTTSIAIAAYGDVSLTDVADFQSYFSYLAYKIQKIYIDGGYTCGSGDDNCGEVTMDTEWSLAMANSEGAEADTAEVFVYEGPNNQGTVVDLLTAMMNDGHARVMSTSWGCQEAGCGTSYMNAVDNLYAEMAAKGWTLVAASGDEGAAAGCGDATAVQYPASDPNVVGVGGTTLNEGSGSNYEVAWTGSNSPGACSKNGGGSTGGFSYYWGSPSYQSSFGFGKRAVPDMALESTYGHDVYLDGGWAHLAGTSVAAPMLAGFFAQENAYLLSIGNKCGSGTSPCAPLGNANYPIYEEGVHKNGGRSPFYDIVSGCNTNDITQEYHLTYYCAGPGYDVVTGWGSANMLQLAWAINWEQTAATGIPNISFSGPATNRWYNTNQTVSWSVVDYNGGGSAPGTGIAGETQGWDSIPADPSSQPHGGSGNSFYSGPQFVNDSTGCLAFEPNGCSGGVTQGCHTVHVEGWNNQGLSTGDSTYGPLCYDNVPPTVTDALSPLPNNAGWERQSVTVTLSANDPGGSGASGIKGIYYGFGATSCATTAVSSCVTYGGPFVVSQQGYNIGIYFTEDNAGNFSTPHLIGVNIDETAPVTKAGLTGILNSGAFTSAVVVTLTATDSLSGVASTTYSLDGGANTTYNGPFTISAPGTHTLNYFSTDAAGNVEKTNSNTACVIDSPTAVKLTSSLNPSVYGQSVTLTATVTATLGATPTGKVTFYDGITILGSVTLSGGTATFTTASLLNGTHSLSAAYLGSTTDLTSTGFLTQVVKDTTATALASSLNPSVFGQSITLTATVTPTHGGTAGGSVTFMDGTTILGTGTLSGNKAALSISTLAVASHALTAVYGGSSSDAGSTSAALTQKVTEATSSTALASSLNPSNFGEPVTLTATITPLHGGSAGGTVTFKDGTTTLGTGTVTANAASLANTASLTTSTLTAGLHSLTAVYGGSTNVAGSTSAALTQTVKDTSTTALASSLNPSVYGESVTLTATVTLTHGGSATGTVAFLDGPTTIGTGTIAANKATLTIATLVAGPHSLKAVYNGDAADAASTSSTLTQTVTQAPSSTTLVSSLNPSVYWQSVTLTATVIPAHGGSAAGTVTFKDGTTTLGTGAVNPSTNIATFATDTLSAGSHSVTAVYGGDGDVNGSTSTALTQKVTQATSTTAVASSLNPSVFGESVTLTATITPAHGGPVTGTVTFKDGTATLGTGTVTSNAATFTTSSLSAGSHSLTAVYGGSTDIAGSTSAVLAQTVKDTTTTALTSSLNPSVFGQSVTLTATITPAHGGSVIGTVAFLDGVTTIGTGTIAANKVTLTTSTLAVGSHSITALYSGSAADAASTSAALTQKVTQATSSTTLTSSLNPSVYWQSVTLTAAVTPQHGGSVTGTVTFTDGTTTLGTGTVNASTNEATLTTDALAAASHSLTAVYGGNANVEASTSPVLTQKVTQATSTTALGSSLNPSIFGESVTLTATVTPARGGPVTGTVTFKDGATTLGTGTVNGSNEATLTTAALAAGSHSLTAIYGGSTDVAGSTSAVLAQTVKDTTTTALASSLNPSVSGQSVTFTATVTAAHGGSVTGTVTFKDGTTTLGTGTVTANKATFSTSTLAVGSHSATAVYGGSAADAASTSAILAQTVKQ